MKKLQPLHFERHKTAKASCFEYDGMIETSLMTEQPAVVNCDVAKMLKKQLYRSVKVLDAHQYFCCLI